MLLSLLLWAYLLPGVLSAAHGYVRFNKKRTETRSAPESQETEPSDIFSRNLEIDFAWGHPDLQRKLWAGIDPSYSASSREYGSYTLAKRAGERIVLPPVIRDLHCLGCVEQAKGKTYTINDLTTDWLENQIILTDMQLVDKCVFYTGVTIDERPTWLPGPGKPGLSKTASYFACSKHLYTLWHLFPGRIGNVAPGAPTENPANRRNYWEIDEPGSWLYGIHEGEDGRFTYFENMSEAMALHCTGKVWLMSLNPRDTLSYGLGTEDENNAHSIWKSIELPALKRTGRVTELIAVTPTGPRGEYGEMWRLDINSANLNVLGEYTGTVPRDLEHHLYSRDTCTDNTNYQPPGEDWFGTGR